MILLKRKLIYYSDSYYSCFSVIDTKYICECYPSLSSALVKDTSLRTVFDYTRKQLEGGPIFEDFDKNYNSVKDYDHVAAFDAMMTGYAFIKISHLIGTQRAKSYKNVADLTHLKEMTNIVNIHNSEHNLRLLKPNPKEDRSDVFLLTGLTQDITNDTLKDAFNKYGMIKIFWVNAKYCWIKLCNRSQAPAAVRDVSDPFNAHNSALKTLIFEKGVNIMTYKQAKEGQVISSLSAPEPISQEEEENTKKRKQEEIEDDAPTDSSIISTPAKTITSPQTTSTATTSAFSPFQPSPSATSSPPTLRDSKRVRRSMRNNEDDERTSTCIIL